MSVQGAQAKVSRMISALSVVVELATEETFAGTDISYHEMYAIAINAQRACDAATNVKHHLKMMSPLNTIDVM